MFIYYTYQNTLINKFKMWICSIRYNYKFLVIEYLKFQYFKVNFNCTMSDAPCYPDDCPANLHLNKLKVNNCSNLFVHI